MRKLSLFVVATGLICAFAALSQNEGQEDEGEVAKESGQVPPPAEAGDDAPRKCELVADDDIVSRDVETVETVIGALSRPVLTLRDGRVVRLPVSPTAPPCIVTEVE